MILSNLFYVLLISLLPTARLLATSVLRLRIFTFFHSLSLSVFSG